MTDLLIVIPTRDRLDLLQTATLGLQNKGIRPQQIGVVDTGSDGTGHWAHRAGMRATTVPNGTFAQAINRGVETWQNAASNILLLNNDVIIKADFIEQMLLSLARGNAIIGARLLYPNGLIQHAGVGFDTDGSPYHLWHNAPAEHPEAMKPRFLPSITFACALIPMAIWEEVGSLDEHYLNAYEDVDWCLRARELGRNVYYEPAASLVHLAGQTAGRFDRNAESLAYYRQKWIDTGRFYYATGVWPFNYGG